MRRHSLWLGAAALAVLAATGVAMVLSSAALAAAAKDEAAPAAANAEGVALTIYNQNFGVVRETRRLKLDAKVSKLEFRDVARDIDPTTVEFQSLTDPDGTRVLEQNYEFDVVTADALLRRYIDQEIAVTNKQGKTVKGRLASFDESQIVLKTKDGVAMIARMDNVANIDFASLPEGLLTKPTLVWKVLTAKPGEHLARVTYQADNMSWRADYAATLSADDTKMDLSGWVTIANRCGTGFKDAQIKLIAGDVRRPRPMPTGGGGGGMFGTAALAEVPEVKEKSFFEYHMYMLPLATTVNDNQVKQVELLKAAGIPITKRYVFEAEGPHAHMRYGDPDSTNVNIYVEFKNEEAAHLGMPLPKGKVRAYKRDPADRLPEFVGEDEISHTAKDEEVRLYVGDAFDVLGSRNVVDQSGGPRCTMDLIRVELRNHKAEDIVVRVREHAGDPQERAHRFRAWELISKGAAYKKVDATTFEFDVPVPKDGKATLEYVFLSWPPHMMKPTADEIEAGLKELEALKQGAAGEPSEGKSAPKPGGGKRTPKPKP